MEFVSYSKYIIWKYKLTCIIYKTTSSSISNAANIIIGILV